MKKKTMGILLISLVMIISIGAISAADANETLQGEVSDTNIALAEEVDDANVASSALQQSVNATSPASDGVDDIEEISVDDSRDENHKVGASSASDEVLSATNEDLLGANPNFYYNGEWYGDLDDAVDDAVDDALEEGGTKTIYLKARAWGYDSAEREITISDGVSITFQPYNSGDEVIFDGQGHTYWFFKISDKNAHITFNDITFRNGGDGSLASDGGAIRIIHGSVTFNNCIFDSNEACSNVAGGYGWGGAIFLDEEDASLIANNCRFTNNKADNGGGAVYVEDGATATFTNCYFEGNTVDGSANHVQDEAGSESSHSFSNCLFKGSGSLAIEVDAPSKTVHITPDVDDDVNYAVLYKNGEECDRTACNDGDTATFSNLEKGSYTVYMMKNLESRYEYHGNIFSITESFFILDGETAFENLSAAVSAIPSGGSGVITVEGGTYTGSANFMVNIINKNVTIMPKEYSPLNPVVFSPSSQQNNLLIVQQDSQLTMEHITMEGWFSCPLSIQTNRVCTISNCEFNNIRPFGDSPGLTIFALNANLVLNGNTFESSGKMQLQNTVVNIDDCTFTSNTYYSNGLGGAIYADSSSNVTVTNSEFTDNIAPNKGGAIYASKLKVENTEFMGNGAGLGGAIYIAGDSNDPVEIIRCAFDTNYATNGCRNIYFESTTRNITLMFNEFDLNLKLDEKDGSYGTDYILDGIFEWGCNLDDNYTFLVGIRDDENLFEKLVSIKDNQFNISMGVLSAGTHEFAMEGMFIQGDSNDHYYTRSYYSDLYGNEFYLNKGEYAKILIEKANITLNLAVNSVFIPEIPVLNVYANWDLNYTIFIGNKFYPVQVVNGKASMQLTDLDLGNHTVVAMRDSDNNFNLAMNFTTFTISKTYSNFIVLSTNVEYDTLNEAVANSNNYDTIYVKTGTYANTGIVISNKTLDIIALDGAVFDARGKDGNFIIVDKNSEVYISGITFRGLHNRNTNYGAIVNHGELTVESCNFTDNRITKTSFARNGGAAIFSDGESLDIDDCNFINNVAPLKVSTAAVTSLGLEDVSIGSCKFINNSAREGGALHFENLIQYSDAIFSCDFEHNIAVKGSAVYVGNNSKYLSVTLSNFKKNDIKNSLGENAQLEGGVIYVNSHEGDSVLDIGASNFEDNSNRNVDGGVIFLDGNSKVYIDASIFTNNRGRVGSVIFIKNSYDKKLTAIIEESNFINNNATAGAIATSPKVSAFIDDCLFANNTGENRHIYSNGFTVVHDSTFDVKNAELKALSVQYGENAIISGFADIGTNIYAAANLTVAGENLIADINNNTFTYKTGILDHGRYYAVLNNIVDANNNEYLMEGITVIFRVNRIPIEFNVSVENITYGETLNVIEKLPSYAVGTIMYQFNGGYYTKEQIESLILDAGNYTLVAFYDHEDFAFSSAAVNFEVSKANPTIYVEDVEVGYGDSIILNIETNVASIYTIEVGDYRTVTFINGSKSIEIEKIFMPGNYTINVTSQERVNYISNSSEAILRVNTNIPEIILSLSDKVVYPGNAVIKVLAPEDAVGNITYGIVDADNNIVYNITQSCMDDLIIPGLNAGIYDVVGVFEGDKIYSPTEDIQFTFMVYKSDVNLTLQFNNITCGEDLVITPKFNMPNVEGSIIYVVGNSIKTLPVNERYIFSGLDEGKYYLAAFYMGSDNYNSCEFLTTVNVRKSDSLLGASNNVNDGLLGASLFESQSAIDDSVLDEENINENILTFSSNAKDSDLLTFSGNDILADEYEEGRFIYQEDEDDDYTFFDTLEDAVDEAILYGAGIITVRGGTYSVSSMDIEGEVELTIRAFGDEEVIFDCGGEDYFMLLTYEEEMEWVQVPPPPHPEFEQTDGPTVTLENITVMNGVATSYGGAIDLEVGTLTLMNCNFINNQAGSEGGAIYIGKYDAENDATLTAINTTFTNNYAGDEGGAIYIAGDNLDGQETSASFYLCTFLDNYQGEDDEKVMNYFAGGNVGEITCQYCVFNGYGEVYDLQIDKINQRVYVNGTSADPFDSVVLLYEDQVPLYTINNRGASDFNVTFEDVMAGNYTVGVMNDHNFNTYIFNVKFEMKVPNFIISEDEVFENLTDAIDAVVENGIIYANVNYYDEDNMEIEIRKSFTLKNFKDDGVVFDGSNVKWFFTIAEGYTVQFDGISFTDGGIKTRASIENYGTLIINNCSFEGFETNEIIYNSGLINILNSTFSLNFVDNALVWNEKDLVINNVEFSSNVINKSSAVYNSGTAKIISSNFTDNSNGGNGGAIYNSYSLIVNNTLFSENEAIDGGTIYNTGYLQVWDSDFEDNTAKGYGGAIFTNGNNAEIYNSSFTGGFSEKDGGAIYNDGVMLVDNSTFVSNSATANGGAIYNNRTLNLTQSFFGINFAEEYANIYNAGQIQFSQNTFDFYDVILDVPDGQYGIPTTITGTLNPEFNMDIHITLPGFVDGNDSDVVIKDGIFEYIVPILPKGVYDVVLNEILYDGYGNIYIGEATRDRLIIHKANVYINLTIDDIIIKNDTDHKAPFLNISASKDGIIRILFNNKFSIINITNGKGNITLDRVDEGNYTVFAVREGDENYNDAVNTTAFKVMQYIGNFIVNSTNGHYDTLREAIEGSESEDVIYALEGNYSGVDNLGLTISGKKLTIIALGDVVFDADSTDSSFLTVSENSDVTLEDIVLTGFNSKNKDAVILNKGNFTFDGCTVTKYNWVSDAGGSRFIDSEGNLNIIDSEFYDNVIYILIDATGGEVIINGSEFENNTIKSGFIILHSLNSAKIISNVFAENIISAQDFLYVSNSKDVLIDSEFYNNRCNNLILAYSNANMLVNNSIFIGNTVKKILRTNANDQSIISESVFKDNAAENIVLSSDKNLSVLESTFSDNTISENGALNIASGNAIVNGSVFTNNKASNYRNIYTDSSNVNITNSVFDAINVDFTVRDVDYGQNETINGTIDIGVNFEFAVNFAINSKIYSVNVIYSEFTLNAGMLKGGDYNAVLTPNGDNSNTFVFDKITKIFTVNRIDPGLIVSIPNITQGENLTVNATLINMFETINRTVLVVINDTYNYTKNVTINKSSTVKIVYELNGNRYTKAQLENLTLKHGHYMISAIYRGDDNYLPATVQVNVEVYKVVPNITISDASSNYTEDIKINVTVDVADYYTVFLGDKSLTLYVEDNATFTFSGEEFKPGSYEITAYVFEGDDYAEAYANATLTVNRDLGIFNLTNDTIIYGENATICVSIPVNAYGNITYTVYDKNGNPVYTIKQSCFDVLVVPDLYVGNYTVEGIFEGDYYYTEDSIINSATISVDTQVVDLEIIVSDIAYEEVANVTINANVDGEYLVYAAGKPFTVTVRGGTGNVSVPDLFVGSYEVNATVVDGNYSGFDEASFEVIPKEIAVVISVGNITYGENATVCVESDVDGDYIVNIRGADNIVSVTGGMGVQNITGLTVGDDILASVTIVNGNYTAYNATSFNVAPKEIAVVISVANITYGENATVVVESDVDGDYLVTVRGIDHIVSVTGGIGVQNITGLTVGDDILASVTILDGNYTAFNATSFNVTPKQVMLVISVPYITYGENATVTVQSDVDGAYIVNVRGVDYDVSVTGGMGVKNITDLSVGDDILATVSIVDGNYTGFNSTTFAVAIKHIDISISAENVTHIDNETIVVLSEVDGEYMVCVNNNTYKVNVSEGKGSLILKYLPTGSYIANVTVLNGNYTGFNSTAFEISKANATMNIYFGNETNGTAALIVLLPEDAIGNVSVYVNGVFSQSVDLINGTTIVSINNLIIGDNNVTVVYSGDDNYLPVNESVAIKRDPTIVASDMTRGYNSGVDYSAKLFDGNGDPLANEKVSIKVGTKTYTVQTDSNGVFKFNDRLALGDYAVVIVNPATGEYKLANLKIVKRIADNKDATIFFADGSDYRVRIIGDDGKYVGAGEVVQMNVGGKTYSAKTDKNGYANFKLNLKVKKHTITVAYKGFTTKNTVTVKSVVKPVKKTVKVKKTAKKLKIKVKLKGKKVLKKKRVYLKFKGKTYKAKTNKKGIATFKVPKKVIKKLKKGKKYKAVFTYKAKGMKNTAKCNVKAR
ncbi:right-handed parallel beta-helix repeat-containing protein [Methanobrevibacter sp. UBA212]|uniref:right-handed parallel beta-helix repeat-containing protein n=1 Tax=Methanobrevibacter sp. UBA212 TaxID=1915476 RepID=UPI0025E51A8D|nr:right-handed parallel beta-helix repeat-containing protein [Methanobrevibacter sp. UBA212]